MSSLLRNSNPFAALGDDTEVNTLNVTLLSESPAMTLSSESYPTLAEATAPKSKTSTTDTIVIIDDGEWTHTHTKTKKTQDVVIEIVPEIVPTQEEDDQLTQEENELFDSMTKKFIKYASIIDANVNESKVQFTRFYTIAVIMLCQIISHLNDIKTKNSIFSRTVIRGLMSVGPNNVNLIKIIYNYLEFCNEYVNEDFAESSFNGYYGKRKIKNFDINYHLTHSEKELNIGDCANKFVTLLKILRTSVAWNIYHATDSYDVPAEEPENVDDWSYSVKTDGGDYVDHSSEKFVSFVLDMGVIHEEFEKMDKELTCINQIFVSAKNRVSSFVERKRLIREYREKQKELSFQKRRRAQDESRGPTERSRRYRSAQNASSAPTAVSVAPVAPVEAKPRAPISAPITWSASTPVSNMFDSDKKPSFIYVDESTPAPTPTSDKYGGFTGKARQNERYRKYQLKTRESEKARESEKEKPVSGAKAKKNERARLHQEGLKNQQK